MKKYFRSTKVINCLTTVVGSATLFVLGVDSAGFGLTLCAISQATIIYTEEFS